MRHLILSGLLSLLIVKGQAQELYVFSEPASNIPAHSLSVKLKNHFVTRDNIYGRFSNRLMPQLFFGLHKNLMLRAGISVANMHTPDTRFESYNLYAKYRIISTDDIHRHFRLSAYTEFSKTRIPFHYDEITLMGDKGGVEAGLVATQLWHKFALSGTLGHTQVLHKSRKDNVIYIPERGYQSLNYSLSGGLLILPREYTNYKQTNLNLYLEIIGQQLTDKKAGFLDLAPAVQLIFGSTTKLNMGYRFQLNGSMQRMASNSWLISIERTFLNALKKKQTK
jgi:hypothetical protein